MLQRLRLENFRGFDEHVVPLRALTILVGVNNAGKSTVVEALRLVALTVNRLRAGTSAFSDIPDWINDPRASRGIQPARIERGRRRTPEPSGDDRSIFYLYNDPPALIEATFAGGASVRVFVGPDGEVHGVPLDEDGNFVRAPAGARQLGFPALAVQPQISALLRVEPYRQDETVRRGEGTYLTSQHFRNQLLRARTDFDEFKAIAERTWPGLEIRGLEGWSELHPDRPIELLVRDYDFVGEIALMGHGLQMWLQTVWFLARANLDSVVVLDEPDVYMHPDLQRRVLNLVRNRFAQTMIATHSIEIVSDVDPRAIVSIDRRKSQSVLVTDFPGAQNVIDSLGGVHNIQVARLFTSRSFLFVEGEDIKLLRTLQKRLSPDDEPIDLVPYAELEGRGGWSSGLPTRLPTRNASGQRIVRYALLDREYFPDKEVAERYAEAKQWNVFLRVWSCKELENYLLVPSAISRFVSERATDVDPPDADDVATQIDLIVEAMKITPITDAFANIMFLRDKKGGITKANRLAREYVDLHWRTREGRWKLCLGKAVISRLSAWAQTTYGVSFGSDQLARALKASEIDSEVAEVLRAVPVGRRIAMPDSG